MATIDGVGEIFDAFALGGHCLDDRRLPLVFARRDCEQRLQLFLGSENAFAVCLVDNEHVADLHDPGLHCLDVITHPRHQYHRANVGRLHNLDLVLTNTDGFDEDLCIACCVEDRHRVDRGAGEAAQIAARCH